MYKSIVSTLKFSRGIGKVYFFSLLVASLFTGAVLLSSDTQAASTYVHNNRGDSVPLRFAPEGTDANNKMTMTNGTRFTMICWTDFKWFNGNYNSNRWFWGQEFSKGSYGYVHASYVINQTSVPHC